MITLRIEKHKVVYVPPAEPKPHVVAGGSMHKLHIYNGVMRRIEMNPTLYDYGTEVRVIGFKNQHGTIIAHATFDQTEWDGLKCKVIEVWLHESNEFILAHPSDVY